MQFVLINCRRFEMFGHHIAYSSTDYDYTYLIVVIILFIITLIVQSAVNNRYNKYSKVVTKSGITGAEAARMTMEAHGVTDVGIFRNDGQNLSDYYDPKTNGIYLSANTYQAPSVAAVGVACHEAGHAIQAAENYGPYRLRRAIIPFASISSKIAIPLIIAGLILSIFASFLKFLALAGIILFAVAVIAQLVTLPVEFDASRRALANIASCNILTEEELKGAKSILSAAAMTYVVATLSAIVQLLRFISLFAGRRK